MRDQRQHAACVNAWLLHSAKDLGPEALLRLFEAALDALWARTATTLGEVTLTAIAERVLLDASGKFPLFLSLAVEPTRGIQCSGLRERLRSAPDSKLIDGMRFVLVELLTVLGKLTAEILTPELHAELANVTLPQAAVIQNRENRRKAARANQTTSRMKIPRARNKGS